jgi:DNA-binding NarL/FixJ family response regulator
MSAAAGRARLVLVEDDAIVRDWVAAGLETTEFELVATAETFGTAVGLIEDHRPDLILVDYRLPGRSGTEAVRELRRRGVQTPAVLMTASPDPGLNESAREAGVQGTVLKTGRLSELLEVLRRVQAGELSFDPRHPRRPSSGPRLSPRERQVLRLVAQGATNREAAEELGIGEQTVKTLLARSYAKLGVSRRSEAVATAYQEGLL